jgi:PAS domain S-box-containing protein
MESEASSGHHGCLEMATQTHRTPTWIASALLLLAGGAVAFAYLRPMPSVEDPDTFRHALVAGSCLLSGVAMLFHARRADAWRGARWLGLGVLALGALDATFLMMGSGGEVPKSPTSLDAVFLAIAMLLVVPAGLELRDHLDREERREIGADVALLTAAVGVMLFLYLRPAASGPGTTASAAEFALIVAVGFSMYGALGLALPRPAHIGLFAVTCGLSSAILTFAPQWLDGTFQPGQARIDLPIALSCLFLAALVIHIPKAAEPETRYDHARYGRAILTTLSVAAACGALGLVAMQEIESRIGNVQASLLIGLLAGAVALRILVNQVRGTHAQRAVQEALDQKEVALRETDKALLRLQRANETLRESEERLRTVFEAADDGIVELDHEDVIVRANGAFCRMIELPQSLVEEQPWTAVAASIEADRSFAALPVTGQGTLRREGQAVYLESRTSVIPSDPPRRLLLVRDVTPARVADQTIRSLFKFLQDRDEDRTRIMRRTNAAIESERNRIARDLHDGPVQGVSAASLSMEAVLLMLKAGDLDEGMEVLAKVRRELSEEADNLRRLMSGLRPPLLEERGLIPALRETLDRYGKDNHVRTEFGAHGIIEVPNDLETLAYRVVQEALANSAKHAKARSITVSVESSGRQLRLEVGDDGIGFDAAKAREYLQMGRVGLASMRERVELANGTFMVHSTPGKGTRVLATLPLDAVPAPRAFSVSEAS